MEASEGVFLAVQILVEKEVRGLRADQCCRFKVNDEV
jgi:hypothetical protein